MFVFSFITTLNLPLKSGVEHNCQFHQLCEFQKFTEIPFQNSLEKAIGNGPPKGRGNEQKKPIRQ